MPIDDSNFVQPDFPSDPGSHRNWQIMRTPTKAPLQMVIVSHVHVGFETHHYLGKTVPHLRSDCPACARHMNWRWTGYLLAQLPVDGKKILFEFPEMAGLDLKQLMETYPDLRGLALQAIRPSQRPNGRVHLTSKGMFSKKIELAEDEPIKPIVYHIWGLRDSAATVEDTDVAKGFTPAERARHQAMLVPPPGTPRFQDDRYADLDGQQLLPLISSEELEGLLKNKNGKTI
jgi:hypothetical protein